MQTRQGFCVNSTVYVKASLREESDVLITSEFSQTYSRAFTNLYTQHTNNHFFLLNIKYL